jgi:hypothetical protein
MVKETKEREGGFVRASELIHEIDVDTLNAMAKQLATSPKLAFRTIRDVLSMNGIYVSQIMELVVGDKAIEIFTHNLYIRLVPYKNGEWDVEVKILR